MAQDSRTVICICIYLHYPNRRIKTVDALSNERVTGHRRCLPTVVITGLYRTGLGITVFQGIIYGNLAKARTGSVDGCSGFHSSVSLSSVVRLSQSLVSRLSRLRLQVSSLSLRGAASSSSSSSSSSYSSSFPSINNSLSLSLPLLPSSSSSSRFSLSSSTIHPSIERLSFLSNPSPTRRYLSHPASCTAHSIDSLSLYSRSHRPSPIAHHD